MASILSRCRAGDNPGPSPASRATVLLLILLVTCVTYLPALRDGFVWDDVLNITENQSLRTVAGLKQIWTNPRASNQYYPLTYTAFWIDYHLWGLRPFGYHCVNILLHALNAVLFGVLLESLSVPGAWLAALIFAVHPVEVQSVAWISECKNVLSVFFYLGALLAYLRFVDRRDRAWPFYCLALLLFGLAMLGKSHAVSLPFVILAVLWWKHERVSQRDFLALTPFIVIGTALALLTAKMEVLVSHAEGPEWMLSPGERFLIAGRTLCFYTGKLFWPHPLMMIYPRWQIDTADLRQYLFPLLAIAAVLTFWALHKRLGKGPLVAVLVFAGILAPTPALIRIAFMRQSYVADQWVYLPGMALIGLATAGAVTFGRRLPREQQRIVGVAAAVVVILLGALSWQHCLVFRNQETLFRDNLLHNPSAWAAHNDLGLTLVNQGRWQEGIGHLEDALRLRPDFAEAHNNLGFALETTGRMPEAIAQFEDALRLRPDYPEAHNNLGIALCKQGRWQEGIDHLEQALRLRPDYPEAHNDLGLALTKQGHWQEGIEQFEDALRLRPDFPEAQYNLGLALAQTGRLPEAITHFQEAVRLRPDYPQAQAALEQAQRQAK